MTPDHDTKDWILNASDEYAVSMGCRFDLGRAQHVIDFFTQCLCLYEGVDRDENGELPAFVPLPWAENALRRCFGWVIFSPQHNRWVMRHRKAFWWLSKKNTKTPVGAGVGLYLFNGMGELGQHVGYTARDGTQAERMQTHGRIMAENSPYFGPMFESGELNYNKTKKTLTHLPTNSTAELITGDNAKSQDGFNGSMILDECHLITDQQGKIVNKSGLSRAQSLVFGISTAGDEDSVFGRKMYDYGKEVESGRIQDYTFMHLAYEAPQTATDEQCKDPAVWRQANPALGTILSEEEFKSDCLQSQRSDPDWIDFKQRRLGIWSRGSSSIIPSRDWDAAAEKYTEGDLLGECCWIGMDLSRSLDMTAIVMCFRDEGGEKPVFRLLPRIWTTERFVKKAGGKADLATWIRDGHLIEMPGRVIDQDVIFEECERLTEQFEVEACFYDIKYANELARKLENQCAWNMVEHSQTFSHLTGPTKLFLEELTAGRLKHNSNPCLTWHAGNANAKVKGDDMHIVKPDLGSWKKIDAIVASIMSLNGAYQEQGGQVAGQCYEDENFNWMSG